MESFHPLIVHFPIALLTASLLIEAPALIFRKEVWHIASFWTLALGWAGAVAAVLSGRQAMAAAKHSMEIHEQRGAAKPIRPALRVAAADRRLQRRSSSTCRRGHAVVVAPGIRRSGACNAASARF